MAYQVSQDFKEKIKDGGVAKACLVLFRDCFFTSEDLAGGGVSARQFFNTSNDLKFGDTPSDTLSFSILSNGLLAGYSFGKCRVYFGTEVYQEEYQFGDITAHIEVGGYTFTASEEGLHRNDDLIARGDFVSLVSDGVNVYAVGLSSSVCYNLAASAVSAYTPTRFMARKLRTGLSAVFENDTAFVWDGETVTRYEFVPMGQYNVEKPRSTAGTVVSIQDAYDNMKLFDVDATEFISALSFPTTLGEVYTQMCNYIGVGFASSTFPYSGMAVEDSTFPTTAFRCRDILAWIGERARCVAHCNRLGQMDFSWLGFVEENINATDISQNGYSMAEVKTHRVSGVTLRSNDGAVLQYGNLDSPYTIYGNPFISSLTQEEYEEYRAIPTYVPMELTIIEADPSIDIGDMIAVQPSENDVIAITNIYEEAYAKDSDTAYAFEMPIFDVPLMSRVITFNGGISAEYAVNGEEKRTVDSTEMTKHNADSAAESAVISVNTELTQENVFNRLTNNGQAQGLFLQDGKIYLNCEYLSAGEIDAAISASNFTMNGGQIDIETSSEDLDAIVLRYEDQQTMQAPDHIAALDLSQDAMSLLGAAGYSIFDYRDVGGGYVAIPVASLARLGADGERYARLLLCKQTETESEIPAYDEYSTMDADSIEFHDPVHALSSYGNTGAELRDSGGNDSISFDTAQGRIVIHDPSGTPLGAYLGLTNLSMYTSTGSMVLDAAGNGMKFYDASGSGLSGLLSANVSLDTQTIAAGGSTTYAFPTSGDCGGAVIVSGSAAGQMGIAVFNASASGFGFTWIGTAASSIGLSGDASGITVGNNGTTSVHAIFILT